ncbi:polynucleotide kinase 3 phosphatase-domain-containing protein [Stachybotrys elegans]|uniref:Polynucleotide kinase 3 phosphatase-domain-containing protein n=1 Tax=Stachybotrys elegans TaxID=80388 RepID=A0A8K0SHG1_9HYPO|nr:polynucleotide kinase 3 phosphatase-domain-containing protein [Stachybotrys elegans]
MSPPGALGKRKLTNGSVSPPPIKRKLQSSTTKSAVASFFTPTPQKPKERTRWSERGPTDDVPATLLVGRWEPEKTDEPRARRKIAAFDLDSTLITTASGKKHAAGAMDWKWWDSRVPDRLRQLYQDDYQLAILSNQAGLTLHVDPKSKAPKASSQKRLGEFKQKCNAILSSLDLPVSIYAATERDIYRKPKTGMWKELCEDYDIPEDEVDLKNSFFVGDAGGRIARVASTGSGVAAAAKDFSCSDRNFAHNVGIEYTTPEEYFLGEKPREFSRDFDLLKHPYPTEVDGDSAKTAFTKKNDQEIVLFCGPPGGGKSTFYWTNLKPLGYQRVNQDILKTRDKCVQAAKDLLKQGDSIAVDNTNADPDTRAVWTNLASASKVPIRCVWFKTPLHICEHNDAVRANNKALNPESRDGLPKLAFTGFASRFKPPQAKEGFQDILELEFHFRGTKEDYQLWGRYWV